MTRQPALPEDVPTPRATMNLGPLADSRKAGVLVKGPTPDPRINERCPDWCASLGTHMRDVFNEEAHRSPTVYAPMERQVGYVLSSGAHCEAHFAAHLIRPGRGVATSIVILSRYGDADHDRVDEPVGRFTIEGARQLIEALTVLINAAETES